jgi:hypothetical protein
MPTFTQIGSAVTVGSGGVASITFSSIPQTYTDLKIILSARLSANGDTFGNTKISFNGTPAGTVYSARNIRGNGSAVASQTNASEDSITNNYSVNGSTTTASTFSNTEIYIPNYTSTSYAKSLSIDNVTENNATAAWATMYAGLWNPGTQAAITSIVLTSNYNPSELYAQHSTAYLYGVSNA